MPRRTATGSSRISTVTSRASNCSDVFLTNRGQASAPGISSFSAAIIWQPLHTPRAKVSGRAKNAANSSRARALYRIDFAQPSPPPSTSPYEKPPHAAKPAERRQRHAPRDDVAHVHVVRLEAGAVERRRHLDLAVDALLAQDGDRRPAPRGDERRGDVLGRIERQQRARCPGSSRRGSGRTPAARDSGLSRSDCICQVVSLHARCSATRVSLNSTLGAAPHANADRRRRRAPTTRAVEAVRAQHAEDARDVGVAHLEDGAQFLGEQRRPAAPSSLRATSAPASIVDAGVAGERHLEQRDEQPAVRPVVVGQHAGRRAAAPRARRTGRGCAAGSSTSGASSPVWPYTCARIDPPSRAWPPARSISTSDGRPGVGSQLRRPRRAARRRTARTPRRSATPG